MSVESLFAAIQKATLPGIWSKGVALSRDNAVLEDARDGDEIKLRVKLTHRPVSPRVTLWTQTEEEDWYCDCGDKVEPCAHIAAAIISLSTWLKEGNPAKGTAAAETARSGIAYRFFRREGSLALERWVHQAGAPTRLEGTLVARVTKLPTAATQADFAADGAISAQSVIRLLKALEDCPTLELDGRPVTASGRSVGVLGALTEEPAGFRLRIFQDPAIGEVFSNGIALCGSVLRPLAIPALSAAEQSLFSEGGRLFRAQELAELVGEILPGLEGKIPVDIQAPRLPEAVRLPPRAVLRAETLGNALSVVPVIVYGEPPIARVHEKGDALELTPGARQVPIRDLGAERQLARRIQSELHLQPGQVSRFEGEAAVKFRLRLKGWEIEGQGARQFTPRAPLQPRFEADAHGGLKLGFESAPGAALDSARVFAAWKSGAEYVELSDGGFAPLPHDWLQRYGARIASLLAARDERGAIPRCLAPEAARLIEETGGTPPAAFVSLRRALKTFDGIPQARLPSDLRAELRTYQRKGIDWLCFLRSAGLGAMLADDMGLGKTLQALCALPEAGAGRALVVMPTSVLESWAEQLRRFRPALKVSTYYGPNRRLDSSTDVTLTTYSVLRLDQDALAAAEWSTLVLDETQTIKNPESQVARAAHRLRAGFRVALSGTPVENRLDDLWSQFRFLNPGLLGSRGDFQDEYASAIARGDSDAADRLRARIRPFILRRLKREVAPELPPRTETVLHCELSTDERELYQSVYAASRAQAVQALEGGGSVFGALEALLRLRQACCHPALLPGQRAETSAKLELLLETLDESISEGHRSLVFSQWTSFLDLIEPKLRERGIAFLRIDGSTSDRGAVVTRFQEPSGPPVLLMSLKAGGVGLTLTAADHVFLLDPWWNPAAEDQAADRAHRIGQDNPVLIHRLVARDTVEERVLALQRHKQDLAGSVLDGSGAAGGITREELLGLLGGT